jgi:autotransporter-associated beta strand protein
MQSSTDTGGFNGYQFRRNVTVGGSGVSMIASANAVANHLGPSTTFDVSDATGDASADLVVSAPLRDQSGDYALAAGALVKTGPGTMALTAANTYTGGTNVQSGTLITATNFSNGTLNVSGGTAQVAQKSINNDPAGVTVVPSLSVNAGTLDLTNNAAVDANTSQINDIRSALASGFASGSWNGQGINSSTAAAFNATNPPHPRALGYADASAIGATTFHGQNVSTAVLIAYTLSGDANLDGTVNALDFNAVATNFGDPTANLWTQADFNYDGQVDTLDFTAMAQNFNQTLSSAPPAPTLSSLVPEPGCLAFGLAGLFLRRRRNH